MKRIIGIIMAARADDVLIFSVPLMEEYVTTKLVAYCRLKTSTIER